MENKEAKNSCYLIINTPSCIFKNLGTYRTRNIVQNFWNQEIYQQFHTNGKAKITGLKKSSKLSLP